MPQRPKPRPSEIAAKWLPGCHGSWTWMPLSRTFLSARVQIGETVYRAESQRASGPGDASHQVASGTVPVPMSGLLLNDSSTSSCMIAHFLDDTVP